MGPEPTGVEADFIEKFGREVKCTGDVFFCDTETHIREEFQVAARKRGLFLDDSTPINQVNVEQLISPGLKRRKAEFEAKLAGMLHEGSNVACQR